MQKMNSISTSDDESEELNRILQKLQRNSKHIEDDIEDGSSDDCISSNFTDCNRSATQVDNDVRQSNVRTSKHFSYKGKLKPQATSSDDEDDILDAKLASLNVIPLMRSGMSSRNTDGVLNPKETIRRNSTCTTKISPRSFDGGNDGISAPQRADPKTACSPSMVDNEIFFDDDDDFIASINYSQSYQECPPTSDVEGKIGINSYATSHTENNTNREHEKNVPCDKDPCNRSLESTSHSSMKSTIHIQPKTNKVFQNLPSVNEQIRGTSSTATDPENHFGSLVHETLCPSNNSNQIPKNMKLDAFGFEIDVPEREVDGENKTESRSWGVQPTDYKRDTPNLSLDYYKQKTEEAHNTGRLYGLIDEQSISDAFGFSDKTDDKVDSAAQRYETHHNDSSQVDNGETDRICEVDPSLYIPKPLEVIHEPIVHYFSPRNRPLHCRKTIPVSQIFPHPISLLWKNKFDTFNQVQSELANMLVYSDDNVVVSAPTGAGKTAVFEMSIARFFATDMQATPPGQLGPPVISKRRKIVYVAPSKALCEERFSDWSKRLSAMNLGIEMAVITGDGDPSDALHDLAVSHFILTTPEKWDSLTRRWTEKFFLFASVKLFLVDEVHLIADESRGCCLEAIICRMKAVQRAAAQVRANQEEIAVSSYGNTSPDAINSLLRFVAVSATLPNIADIAMVLEANEAHVFDESYRPVPLTTHVIGQGKISSDGKNGQFMFWKNLDRNIPELIIKYSSKRPTIVFCHSKADCEKLADLLAITQNIGRRDNDTSGMASQTRVPKLQRVLLYGIAYHHAGLEADDRHLVESSFTRGMIRVLCATSTIAMGVNLPAHLVIVKGTSAYRGTGEGGGYQDIDQASLLQMIGRAGRPGFDNAGTAIVMTDNDSKTKFEHLVCSGLPLARSQLVGLKLIETMNTEVSQRVITSIETAVNWMKGTLYYIQLLQDPEAHGVKIVSNYSIDTHLFNVCQSAFDRLQAIGTLVIADGEEVYPLAASHIMSHRIVSFAAMKEITTIPFNASHAQILSTTAKIEGLQYPVRRSEKKTLNNLHKELKLYKLDGPLSKARVQEPWQKSFVLLQAFVDELEHDGIDYSMRQEMNSIADFATRMLSAIEEYSLKGSKSGNVLVQGMKLRRSIAVHLWSAKDGVLRQIKGIGKGLAFSLLMNGIGTFDDVMKNTEGQLEKAASRSHPFGATLRKACASILKSRLTISADIETGDSHTNSLPVLSCLLKGNYESLHEDDGEIHTSTVSYTIVMYLDDERGILFSKQNIIGPETFKCTLPHNFGSVHIQLIASIVGLDDSVVLNDPDQPVTSVNRGEKRSKELIKAPSKDRVRDPLKHCTGVKRKSNCLTVSSDHPLARHCVTSSGNDIGTKSPLKDITSTVRTNHDAHELHESHTLIPDKRFPTQVCNQNVFMPSPKAFVSPSPLPPKSLNVFTASKESTNDFSTQSQIATSVSRGRNNTDNLKRSSQPLTQQNDGHQLTPSRHEYPLIKSNCGYIPSDQSASWKRFKYQHQKIQQRAFVRNSDNPFNSYKHDPNDSETYLDQLSNRTMHLSPNNQSIIPPEGFLAIRSTSPSIFTVGSTQVSQRGIMGRRYGMEGAPLSIPDLLSQKAAESNTYSVNAAHKAPTNQFPTSFDDLYQHQEFYRNHIRNNGSAQARERPYYQAMNNFHSNVVPELNPTQAYHQVQNQIVHTNNQSILHGDVQCLQKERTLFSQHSRAGEANRRQFPRFGQDSVHQHGKPPVDFEITDSAFF